jgi:hypothetical protein
LKEIQNREFKEVQLTQSRRYIKFSSFVLFPYPSSPAHLFALTANTKYEITYQSKTNIEVE